MSDPWIIFWIGLLGLTIMAYTVLAVVVTIGGFRDIRAMFRRLRGTDGDGTDSDRGDEC